MTPKELDLNRRAWLGSLMGIAEWTGASLADVAKRSGPPPYAKEGDGEAERIAELAAKLDAQRAAAPPDEDGDGDGDEDDGDEDPGEAAP